MPTYEYKCKKGHVFDVMQRMSDDSLTECQVCGAPVQRVFHPIAVHFKGSGFYNTDYGTRKRSREAKESADGKSAGDGAKTSETKTSSSETKTSDSKKAEPSKASASSSSSSSSSD